ncbi:MAG TPA: hypothetical protein VGD53_14145 [Actinoallomurus sp.]|jgi:membrane protein YdbS with pleckstrin-like domain
MTLVLVSLFVVVAPLAVIADLAAAAKNFFDGSVAGGAWMLIMAAVLTVVLLVPAFFLWRTFLRKSKPLDLMINDGGFTLLEGEEVLRRLPWERVTSVRLSPQAKKKTEHLVVSTAQSDKPATSPTQGAHIWMDLPLSKMDGERSALVEAITHYSRGRYTTSQ